MKTAIKSSPVFNDKTRDFEIKIDGLMVFIPLSEMRQMTSRKNKLWTGLHGSITNAVVMEDGSPESKLVLARASLALPKETLGIEKATILKEAVDKGLITLGEA